MDPRPTTRTGAGVPTQFPHTQQTILRPAVRPKPAARPSGLTIITRAAHARAERDRQASIEFLHKLVMGPQAPVVARDRDTPLVDFDAFQRVLAEMKGGRSWK